MPNKPQTSKEYFTVLTILHGALLMAQVLFAALAYYLVSSGQFATSPELTSILPIVALALVFAGSFASSFIMKGQLKSIKLKPVLKDKMKDYRAALIIKWALMEAPSLFCTAGYLLTGNHFFLWLAALEIVIFFFARPTMAAAGVDLELSQPEKLLIENPDSIIAEVGQTNLRED
jgi:hypothetical protein